MSSHHSAFLIKAPCARFVKARTWRRPLATLFALMALTLTHFQSFAQDDEDREEEETSEESAEENDDDFDDELSLDEELPPPESKPGSATNVIEVKIYEVSVVRFSRSMRVYLFEDKREEKPRVGKIILLRDGPTNVMAFRVIKLYKDQKQFAASRVRKYGDFHFLDPGTNFKAYEKVGDLTSIPQGEVDDLDKSDLKTLEEDEGLESDPSDGEQTTDESLDDAFDEETPSDEGAADEKADEFDSMDGKDLDELDGDELSDEVSEDDELDAKLDEGIDDRYKIKKLVIETIRPLEKHSNWFSLEIGYFLAGGRYLSGFSAKFGTNIGNHLFLEGNSSQDVLTLELGFARFNAANLSGVNDNYTVLPLMAHMRYNVFLSENFLLFAVGGLNFNLVLETVNGDAGVQDSLEGMQIALGGGAMFRFGPQWFFRLHVGLESAGGGLVIRF